MLPDEEGSKVNALSLIHILDVYKRQVLDDKIYFRENSRMAPVEVSDTAENRIQGMIRIRDSVRTCLLYTSRCV